MFHLTQYIIVRRDIPLEKIPVYTAHAAGIATFAWCAYLRETHPEASWERLDTRWGFPSRIIRGSKTEERLKRLVQKLKDHGVTFYEVVEPDPGPFQDQLMAVALLPDEKDNVKSLLNDFQDLRFKDVPDFIARGGRRED
jgi:hypothetical protein